MHEITYMLITGHHLQYDHCQLWQTNCWNKSSEKSRLSVKISCRGNVLTTIRRSYSASVLAMLDMRQERRSVFLLPATPDTGQQNPHTNNTVSWLPHQIQVNKTHTVPSSNLSKVLSTSNPSKTHQPVNSLLTCSVILPLSNRQRQSLCSTLCLL